ncbi:hypothetical protein HN587_00325 [Candidatus Woesearchaeota archaeon]|jgi:hypothetical protein|nr:hypothetical protein [Candidatus Woesearchaeota archaeon]
MNKNSLFGVVGELYDRSLEDVIIVGCQHFLEGQYLLFSQLFSCGLLPENTYLIGKSYSFNNSVQRDLSALGVSVYSYEFNSHLSFDDQFSKHILQFIQLVKNKANLKDKHVVVIDDGGALLSVASNYFCENLSGVEQTSSGYSIIKNNVSFPIVNVARSKTKLIMETPHIVDCFLNKLNFYLDKYGLVPQRALILGGGPIGVEVQKQLNFETCIFDTDLQKRTINQNDLHEFLCNFDLIVGASGNMSLRMNDYSYLREGTVLASISSSDREFDSVKFRVKFPKTSNPHQDYHIGGIYLLNSGFPLTFDGSRVAVPTENIILTQSLMFAGVYESLNHKTCGLYDLSSVVQRNLVEVYQEN